MSAVFTTILDGLEVAMRLGVHEGEVTTPQRVRLSVWMEVDYGAHSPADRIEDALDYDFVRRGIHDFAGRHFALQETLRSEEHTSALQSLMRISYAVFCLKKKKKK